MNNRLITLYEDNFGYTHYTVDFKPQYQAPTRVIHLAASAVDPNVPGSPQDDARDHFMEISRAALLDPIIDDPDFNQEIPFLCDLEQTELEPSDIALRRLGNYNGDLQHRQMPCIFPCQLSCDNSRHECEIFDSSNLLPYVIRLFVEERF